MNAALTSMRIPRDDLAEIDKHAKALKLSRTAFLIDSALKRLPDHQNTTEQRLNAVEQAVERLERAANIGAL